jgi:hypothetical protein
MKKSVLFSAISSLLLLSCNPSEKKESTSGSNKADSINKEQAVSVGTDIEKSFPFITGEGIGAFKIGSIIPKSVEGYEIKREIVVEETEEGDYQEEKFFVLKNGEKLWVLSTQLNPNTGTNNDTISEINILSDKLKTKEGIGLNSRLESFIDKYPDQLLWYTYIGAMFVLESPSVEGAQFILDEKDFTGKVAGNTDSEPVRTSDFKKDAKIKKIRIIGKSE